jgi:CubicO group peptidase (beta-lactamase class C family)
MDSGPPDDATQEGDANACSAYDFDAFDTAVSAFLTAHALAGASAVVVHKDCGILHLQGYGQYPANRLYLVGSASKIVTVGVLMRLADQGLLDLDAPIGQYLATFGANGKPELEVAQLVSNSSGLVGLIDNPFYLPYRCQYQDAGSLADCAKAIYTANDAADRQPPDTSFHYGGGQWQLAGGIAEVIAGRTWADQVRQAYGDLCHASSIGYANQFAKATQLGGLGAALRYPSFFQGDTANLPATENPNVEGGLYTTVEDYGKVLLMHLRGGECEGGRVLSQGAVARMRVDRILETYNGTTAGMAGRTNGGGGLDGYGMGWWIDRTHPGVFADPGLYGSFPWLDLTRGYGAFLAIEANGDVGGALWQSVKPDLDAVFAAAGDGTPP